LLAIEVAGQPDLFGTPQVSEPTVVKKPGKLTPQEVGTTVNDDVLGALGIGRTAIIRKNKLLEGKDISNPADAAEVRRVLGSLMQIVKTSVPLFVKR